MKKMTVSYHHNLETGEVQILVDYASTGKTKLHEHEEEHWQYIQQLLEKSGLLSGVHTVRIRRGDGMTSVYRVEILNDRTVWELQTESPIP